MLSLWRKTFSLLRQFPVLWLPALLAALVSSVLNQLVQPLVNRLILTTSMTHSVLGGSPEYAPPSYLHILLIGLPFNLALVLVSLLLSAAALLATASILQNPAQKTGQLDNTFSFIRSSRSRALSLSLKLFFVELLFTPVGILGAPLLLLFENLQRSLVHSLDLRLSTSMPLESLNLPSFFATRLTMLPYAIVVILFFAPAAVRLLQAPDFVAFLDQVRKARIAAVTFAAVSVVLDLALPLALRPMYEHLTRGTAFFPAINTAASLIRALPNVPLFVAFALLARGDEPNVADAEGPTPESLAPQADAAP